MVDERAAETHAKPVSHQASWFRRVGRWLFLYAVIPYLSLVVLITVFQRWLIYPGKRSATIRPDAAGLPPGRLHELKVETFDGLILNGWLVLADGHAARTSETLDQELAAGRPLILYFPGNAGNRLDRSLDCREFAALGCDVILFDYRGYGDNPGRPSEEALAADAHAIWKLATAKLQVAAKRIVLFGESLGGAVATRLASQISRDGTPPGGLILTSTFSSMTDVASWHYPYFPIPLMLLDRYPSTQRISSVTCPIEILHGTDDGIVPIELGRKLFTKAPDQSANGTPKRFVELSGTGHNGISMQALKDAVLETTDVMRKKTQ